jgi:hypothetical protein
MATKMIGEAELITPHLGGLEHAALLLALNSVILNTGSVHVSLTYEKQTNTRPRVAGEDYVAMPGVSPATFIGQILLVGRNKKSGSLYFYVPSLTRADGSSPRGPTNLKPEGVRSFVVMGFIPRAGV